MKIIDYRWYGIGALAVYAIGGIADMLPFTFLGMREYGVMIFIAISFIAGILAELWAIQYWRISRTRLSVAAFVCVTVILFSSIVSIQPMFDIMLNHSFN